MRPHPQSNDGLPRRFRARITATAWPLFAQSNVATCTYGEVKFFVQSTGSVTASLLSKRTSVQCFPSNAENRLLDSRAGFAPSADSPGHRMGAEHDRRPWKSVTLNTDSLENLTESCQITEGPMSSSTPRCIMLS